MNACHYTTRYYAAAIFESGFIVPATAYVPEDETPIVWFSRATAWEPTASKCMRTPTGDRTLTFPEMARVGVARFVVNATRLLPWPELWRAANMHPNVAASLARAGRRQGANPRDWCGVLKPVPIADVLTVQVYDTTRTGWRDARADELKVAA